MRSPQLGLALAFPLLLTFACSSTPQAVVVDDDAGGIDASPMEDAAPPPDAGPGVDSGPVDAAPPSDFDTVNGISAGRAYVAYVPKKPSSASLPLVFVLHGDGGSGASMHSYFPFEQTTKNDAIVVFPSGKNGGSWDLYAVPPAGDYPYFDAMFTDFQAKYNTDPKRIFFVGWSQGGFYSNQFSCWRSNKVRAIVSIAGGAPDSGGVNVGSKWPNGSFKCDNNQGPVPIMAIHGTADNTVVVGSGEYSAAYWAAINGCKDTRAAAAAFAPCELHNNCPVGKEAFFCPVVGGGHGIWNGSAALGWKFLQTFQ